MTTKPIYKIYMPTLILGHMHVFCFISITKKNEEALDVLQKSWNLRPTSIFSMQIYYHLEAAQKRLFQGRKITKSDFKHIDIRYLNQTFRRVDKSKENRIVDPTG